MQKLTPDDPGARSADVLGANVDQLKALFPGDATCVLRDSAFADDVAKTSLAAILEQHGLKRVRSL